MSTAEEAIAAGAKAPQDRLGKTPRRTTIGIYLDEALAEAHEQAVAELEHLRSRQLAEHPRRTGLAMAEARDQGLSEAEALETVETAMRAELVPLQEAVDKTLAALDEGTLWLTFRSLGRTKFRALMAQHPASAQDQQDWEDAGQQGKAPYAPESFARQLIEEASFGRVLSHADVLAMAEGDAWNEQEWAAVFQTASAAQTAARAVQHRTAPRR